ncbi:methionine ABC transporter ATP-binding protein [Janibacter melonis]|uniref:methionine ABC transporter ATP-binding protein n=1 Tax=Janibacter melonis TaxID=262209 RepID=UPI00338C0E9C
MSLVIETPTPSPTPLLRLRSLSKSFRTRAGEVRALDDIDLTVDRGSIHGIIGRSGAGKSTLIRTITGLETPTSGHVDLDGTDVAGLRGGELRAFRRRFGMVFQHANLLSSRTAAQNIALPLEIAGRPAAERATRVAELLDLVGLEGRGDSYPAQLSGGQQQRVGIARALATRPDILICDEPTSALDSATTRSVLALLSDLRDELGITVVVITHEPSVVREICDVVTVLQDGRVTESGPIAALAADPATQVHRDLLPLPVPAADEADRVVEVTLGHGGPDELEQALTTLRAAGMPARVHAATIETIDDVTLGRARLLLPVGSDRDLAERTLQEARA